MYKAAVDTALLHQLAVRALLGKLAARYDTYLVGVLDGVETVCDDDQRFAFAKLGDSFLNIALVATVNARCRCVEDNDRGIL